MSDPTPTIEAPRRRGPVVAAVLAVAVVAAAVVVFLATRGGAEEGGDAAPVRIGVVGASDPYWKDYEEAAAKEGIEVEIVDFTDYAQPNPALAEGELDLNQFQHLVYLADYNVSKDQDLTPIGSTGDSTLARLGRWAHPEYLWLPQEARGSLPGRPNPRYSRKIPQRTPRWSATKSWHFPMRQTNYLKRHYQMTHPCRHPCRAESAPNPPSRWQKGFAPRPPNSSTSSSHFTPKKYCLGDQRWFKSSLPGRLALHARWPKSLSL